MRHFVTPLREGYVRSHNKVPIFHKEDDLKIDLFFKDDHLKTITMKDLKKMPQHEVMVCMRCAG